MILPNRGLKNIRRVRKILGVFLRYGFRDVLYRLTPVRRFIPSKIKAQYLKGSSAERMRKALEELGPTFIKLGQILSVRTDILPRDYIIELSKLQDSVESINFDKIKDRVEDELEKPMGTLFSSFEKEPLASASLAQVHSAYIKDSVGEREKVVVKILRPGVREIIETDLSILETIAEWAENEIPEVKQYEPVALVEELKKNLDSEIKFSREGRSIERFGYNFKTDEDIIIPKVYWDYTTDKILTMQYIRGTKITNVKFEEDTEITKKEFVGRISDFVFRQIFEYRFFHADPHPGNILITDDSKISMLDYGLMGSLDDDTLDLLIELIIAINRKDVDRISQMLIELKVANVDVNRRELKYDIKTFIDKYYGISLKRVKINDIFEDMFKITRRYGLKLPRDLLLLSKTVTTLEGVMRQVEPEYNLTEEIKPYVKELIQRKYSPVNIFNKIKKILIEYYNLIKKLPGDLSMILREIRDGTLKVEFEHRGLDNLILHGERSANRLSLSLIIASLIVGSALILQTGRLFIPGIIGFVIAGILGIGLIIAILRSGRI